MKRNPQNRYFSVFHSAENTLAEQHYFRRFITTPNFRTLYWGALCQPPPSSVHTVEK